MEKENDVVLQEYNSSSLQMHRVFQIAEIFEHILSFCRVSDLKCCRLVCLFWSNFSTKMLKLSTKVKLRSTEKMKHFVLFLNDKRATNFRPSLYSNFYLTGTHLNNKRLEQFFTLCKSNIKTLEWRHISIKNATVLLKIVLELCTNLKELALRDISYKDNIKPEVPFPFNSLNHSLEKLTIYEDSLEHLDISWLQWLKYCPNLKKLDVNSSGRFHTFILNSMHITCKDASKLNIQEAETVYPEALKMNGYMPLQAMAVYSTLKQVENFLHLKALSLVVNGNEDDLIHVTLLQNVLWLYTKTLKKLTLERDEATLLNPEPIFYNGTKADCLGNIHELELKSPVFSSMKFLRCFPNLKRFSFNQTNLVGSTSIADFQGVHLIQCTDLKVGKELSMEEIRILRKVFPKLKRLRLSSLDNEMFEFVCCRWSKLVSLEIVDSRVDEAGITGLDVEDVERINKGESEKDSWRPVTVQRANISLLTDLQKFSMRAMNTSAVSGRFLSHCSKLYGFEQTPKLEHFRVVNYTYEKESYSSLRKRLPKLEYLLCDDDEILDDLFG